MGQDQDYPDHTFRFRVPLSYIDTGGVVYNGRYLDIYNQARDEQMRDIGYPYMTLVTQDRNHLTVVEANVQYKAPVFYDDVIDIVSRVEKIGSRSIIVNQAMYRQGEEQPCNQARFVMVCVGEGFKTCTIPAKLIHAHQLQEKKNENSCF